MQHLAIIPDGNRRWAKKNKLQTLMGHKRGGDAIKETIEACLEENIKYLSIYIFSLENFNRSETEKEYLFRLIPEEFKKNLPYILEKKIKIKFIGNKDLFPKSTLQGIDEIEEKTKNFNTLTVNFLFCYGGRQEIIAGVKKTASMVKNGELKIEDIDESLFKSLLWGGQTPDPELIIRTSGISRLSNFLTFQSVYSELMFLDCFWPDITKDLIKDCINKYKQISRNFGR